MKIFIDSANVDEIREVSTWGIVDGVTTNPSLIAQSGRSLQDVIEEICTLIDGPISAECNEVNAEQMIPEARQLAKLHPNIVVKIPLTIEGIKTVSVVAKEGIRTNVTLCFSAAQGLLAAKAGATYISPFIGRLDDIGHVGYELIDELVDIYGRHNLATQILAASIRSPRQVTEVARIGAHVATIPYKVLNQLIKHPLTDKGLEKFLADWQKTQQ